MGFLSDYVKVARFGFHEEMPIASEDSRIGRAMNESYVYLSLPFVFMDQTVERFFGKRDSYGFPEELVEYIERRGY